MLTGLSVRRLEPEERSRSQLCLRRREVRPGRFALLLLLTSQVELWAAMTEP